MLNLLRAELLRLISNRKMAVLGAFVLGLGFWISASMAVTLKPYTALEWDEARRQSNDAQINLEVICGSSSSSSDCTALPTNITVEGFLRPQMSFEQFVVASLELTMQMGLLIVVVLITVMVGAEFSTGSIGTQLTFTPRRLPLLWAKALASAICGVCLMAIWAAAVVLLGVFFYLNVRGIEGLTASSLLGAQVGRALLAGAVMGMLAALVTMALASTARVADGAMADSRAETRCVGAGVTRPWSHDLRNLHVENASARRFILARTLVMRPEAAWRTPRPVVTANVCSCGRLEHR